MKKKLLLIIAFCLLLSLSFSLASCRGVAYDLNFMVDGEIYHTLVCTGSTTLTLPEDPVKEGYIFDGWYYDNDTFKNEFKVTDPIQSSLFGDLNVYAKWTEIPKDDETTLKDFNNVTFPDAEVTYDGTEKSISVVGAPEGATVKYEGTISATNAGTYTATATVTMEGYNPLTLTATLTVKKAVYDMSAVTFQGGTFSYDGEAHSIEIIGTLPAGVTVTYDGNGVVEPGSSVVTANFTGDSQNYEPIAPLTAQITVLEPEIITHSVSFVTNGAADEPSQTVEHGKLATEPTAISKNGYNLIGWYNGDSKWDFANDAVNSDVTLTAKWVPAEYSISYELGGATNSSANPIGFTIESATITFTDATKRGYTFLGWFTDPDFTERITEIPAGSTGNYVLYASWKLNEYTVSYITGGGTNSSDNPDTYTVESEKIILSSATKPGYNFLGWYTDEELTTPITEISAGSASHLNLYAKWETAAFSITYVTNGGINPSTNPTGFNVESGAIKIAAATRTGYEFTGWYTDEALKSKITEIPAGSSHNYTLYAGWEIITYSISYISDGNIDTSTYPKSFNVTSAEITLPSPTRTGYTFDGWYNNADYAGKAVTTIPEGTSSAKTLYAKWTVNNFSISYTLNGGTNNSKNPTSYNVTSAKIMLSDPTRTGYEFTGWYTDAALTTKITEIDPSSMTSYDLYAGWNAEKYTITYVSDGTITNNNVTEYDYETSRITLSAPTRKGYVFVNWYSAPDFSGKPVLYIYKNSTGDKTLYAKWEVINYKITYVSDGTISNNSNPTSYTYDSQRITLANPTRDGYIFGGWYDNASLDGKAVKYIYKNTEGDKTFYAKWTVAETFTITYELGGGTNNASNITTYSVATLDPTLHDPSYDRHYFLGWYSDAAFTSPVNALDTTNPTNITLYAKWEDVVVYYSDFGKVTKYADLTGFKKIVGDGVTDDFLAIINAHEWANLYAMKICGDSGKTYYIGEHAKTAVIKTNVDWTGSSFIIDDRSIGPNDAARNSEIFNITYSNECKPVTYTGRITSLTAAQPNIGMTFDRAMMVRLVATSTDKIYIRYGGNANDGSVKTEIILVDKDGNVDESTPIMWDYPQLQSIIVYPQEAETLTVTGGTFTTRANQYDASVYKVYKYYKRGISIIRSNTVIDGMKHYITDEQADGTKQGGYPYNGFYNTNNVNNVLIQNCVMQGHTAYQEDRDLDGNGKFETSNSSGKNEFGAGTTMGSYDIIASYANNITWKNCTQANEITDRTYWGIMGSNFCKNMTYDGCSLSRFDAHCGIWNATIKNSTIGFTLSLIGGGTATIENTTKKSGMTFIELRSDYGSLWRGDVVIKNSTFYPYHSDTDGDKVPDAPYTSSTGQKQAFLFTAQWQYNHYFGYTIYMPQNVIVDNFTLGGNTGVSFYIVNLYNYTQANVNAYGTAEGNATCPIVLFKSLKFTNCSGGFALAGTNGFANSYLGGFYSMSKSDIYLKDLKTYYKTYTITKK